MNITINQNQSPAFGILKLKGYAARTIADEIAKKPDPVAAEKYFIENIAEPINRLKSTIICDNDMVSIMDESTGTVNHVLDTTMGKFAISNYYGSNNLSFFTNMQNFGYSPSYKILSFASSEEANKFREKVRSSIPLIGDLLCAKKYVEQTESSPEEIEQKLKNLYG